MSARHIARAALCIVYAIVLFRFFQSGLDPSVFVGMIRPGTAGTSVPLADNMYSAAFAFCGVILPMGRLEDYLSEPRYFAYVRQRRSLALFSKYAARVALYSILFSAPQAALAAAIVPEADRGTLWTTTCCGAMMLIVMLFMRCFGHLLRADGIGYAMPIALFCTLVASRHVAVWFANPSHWGLLLGVLAIGFAIGDAALFHRYEII